MNKQVIVVLCAVMGFATMMAVQSIVERHNGAATPQQRFVTCQTEPTQAGRNLLGGTVYLTNPTRKTIRQNQFIFYTIANSSGKFVLTEDLAPNATLKQRATAYTGNPGCKAWIID